MSIINREDQLVDKLRKEQPDTWRVLVFTRWRETQMAIYAFLEERGVRCGLIHGDSGKRNAETLLKFRKAKPEINVIVSTEAGSEGINLQSANVLVNYDLPWNPMIVEQRIGRIQRLASEFAGVFIFNIVLKGTFEEYIVGRLMEKLQMASHAIGDIEALLEASGMDDEDKVGTTSFEEQVRKLVVASLAGKDVEKATHLAEKSISDAKVELEREEDNMNALFGRMDSEGIGPAAPKLPVPDRSMDVKTFTLKALKYLGADVIPQSSGAYLSVLDGRRELIRFADFPIEGASASTLYAPGSPPFERLVAKVAARPLHLVSDSDENGNKIALISAGNWITEFGGRIRDAQVEDVRRGFDGKALVRVRATVAHDSYERLLETSCNAEEHVQSLGPRGANQIAETIEDPEAIGMRPQLLVENALLDEGINAFCRYYGERRSEEIKAAGNDNRKKTKLSEDFTPRLDISLSGVEGTVNRTIKVRASYLLDSDTEYTSNLDVAAPSGRIVSSPEVLPCELTQRLVPSDCLWRCEISGKRVIRHLLVSSELSGRHAISENTIICALSGKRILKDEGTASDVTGEVVTSGLLKTSGITGRRAEPRFFGKCDFTGVEALESELAVSQVSRKKYRSDEETRSVVSGKSGHRSEFIQCPETQHVLLAEEAEKCEITGKLVVPGLLETCEVSQKHVLPSELERCAATKKKALHRFFVTSSTSGARVLQDVAVSSLAGKYCVPQEAKACIWSGQKIHPDDVRHCELTGLTISVQYVVSDRRRCLEPMVILLDGVERKYEQSKLWEKISQDAAKLLKESKCVIESASLSPDRRHLAVALQTQSWLGLKTRVTGLVYSIGERVIVGRVVVGRRLKTGWIQS